MAHVKSRCLYCDGRGKLEVLRKKVKCPWCFPPPGHIHAEYCDEFTKITTYGKDGKVRDVDEIKHKTRRSKNESNQEDRTSAGDVS